MFPLSEMFLVNPTFQLECDRPVVPQFPHPPRRVHFPPAFLTRRCKLISLNAPCTPTISCGLMIGRGSLHASSSTTSSTVLYLLCRRGS
jgi:hypothetical protein